MNELTTSAPEGRFQILSLDGGGLRGLFSAALLAAVEDDLKTNVSDHFDLIAGTSTGGIIALGLGLGMSPREIVEFYVDEGPRIFHNRFGLRTLQQWLRRKYSAQPLTEALQRAFGERTFGESTKRLVIPAYELGADDVYIFRTPHHERLARDFRVAAWRVALATAAAPTFFPACRDVDRLRLVDGGVWANNPAMVALVEAVGTLGVKAEQIRMLSVGTSEAVVKRPQRLDGGGIISWGRESAVVDVLMRAQSIGINNQARLLLGKDRFLRIDPKVSPEDVLLDQPRQADALIGRAAYLSRVEMPSIKNIFINHRAARFVPLHSL